MKSRRHRRIMEIVNNQRVATQEELCEALRSNGFDVTQATVSRDIKELHLVKIPDGDGYRYAVPDAAVVNRDQERLHRIMKDSVIHMDYSENIIVIKTFPEVLRVWLRVLTLLSWTAYWEQLPVMIPYL